MINFIRRVSLIAILSLGSTAVLAEPILLVDPEDQTVEVSDQVSIDIIIAPGQFVIGAFDFIIEYDPTILELGSTSFGTGLGGPFGSFQTADSSLLPDGQINFAEFSFLGNPELTALQGDNPFVLVSLLFDAVSAGTSPLLILPNIPIDLVGLGLPVYVGDEFGVQIDGVEVGEGRVVVTARPVVVSEPPVTWLGVFGLLAFLLARRRAASDRLA